MIADYTGSQRKIILDCGIQDANSVLDVGCGNGEKTFYIAQCAQWSIGIDPDKEIIQEAKNKYNCGNLVFQVAQAESLCFSNASFVAVLFNESLHHVSVDKQVEALKESHRVLEAGGRLLITEPIYGSGSFGEILEFYSDEKEQKRSAVHAIESVINSEFSLSIKKKIRIEYHYKNFDDLYENTITATPYNNWHESNKNDIIKILKRCDITPEGGSIIDYLASVWLLIKR
jgi:ubiquinone/menaquinone biosynthesis C-methylase UbiE